MKNTLLLLLTLAGHTAFSQVVSGLYTGTLRNDSTGKEQQYELALSEYRGKITGYSYTTFVRNDSLFYSIKRVKGSRKEKEILVEDESMIANNFPEKPAKGVRQVNHIALTNEDTLRTVTGTWETTRTKIYYSLSGKSEMALVNDSLHSSLIAHLKELGIIQQAKYREDEARNTDEIRNTKADSRNTVAKVSENKNVEQKPAQKKSAEKAVVVKEKKTAPIKSTTSLPYSERRKNSLAPVETGADSLELSFYDNGVVDGDSVSLYVNGTTAVTGVKLTATATKRTITLPNTDTVELLLVAENLGTLPPNTGLIVIRDGSNTYQLHFSADLQTNASIIIKRKKK